MTRLEKALNKMDELLDRVFEDESAQAKICDSFENLKCWDSLHYVQLVVGVQTLYGIELSQGQIQAMVTPQGLFKVLQEHGVRK